MMFDIYIFMDFAFVTVYYHVMLPAGLCFIDVTFFF